MIARGGKERKKSNERFFFLFPLPSRESSNCGMGGLKCYYLLRVLKHTVGAREKNLVDHARQRAPELGFVMYMHIIYLHRRARESAGKCAGMLGGV